MKTYNRVKNKVADAASVGYTVYIFMQNKNADLRRYTDGGTRHEHAYRMSGSGGCIGT